MSEHRRHHLRHGRRAYALMLVMLVAFVATMTLGVILDRHSSGRLAVQRQINRYEDHHAHAGMREMVSRWLGGARSMDTRLDEDGLAFTLELPDRTTFDVYMMDGQDAVLTNMDSLAGARNFHARQLARVMAARERQWEEEGTLEQRLERHRQDLIAREYPVDRLPFPIGFTRRLGPSKVNVNTASEEVLSAAIDLSIVEGEPERLLRDLLAARDEEDPIDSATLRQICVGADMNQGEISTLTSVLATDTTLWAVIAVRRDWQGVPIAYSGGLLPTGRPSSSSSDFAESDPFLSWETISLQ